MTDDITIVLGGASPLARALATKFLGTVSGRLILADRENPVDALVEERAPILRGAETAPPVFWRSAVEQRLVEGVATGPDTTGRTVGMLGLLRPRAVMICAALRAHDAGSPQASRFGLLSDDLTAALSVVRDYCRLAQVEEGAKPLVIVAVTGLASSITADVAVSLTEAIVVDQLGELEVDCRAVMLPRLLGSGPNNDTDFHELLRTLLSGRAVHRDGVPSTNMRFLDQCDAAQQLLSLISGEHDVPRSAEGRSGPVPVTILPGHACSIPYLATIIADELDQLLAERASPRKSLLDPLVQRAAKLGANHHVAPAIRQAVRWYAANASLLGREAGG